MYSIASSDTNCCRSSGGSPRESANRIDDGYCDIVKTLSSSGADVVNAGDGMFPKVQIDIDDVAHVDKVTALFAVLVAVTGLEKLYAAMLAKLIECMECNRRHPPLMRFARSVHVEIPQAHHRSCKIGQTAGARPRQTRTSNSHKC